MKIRISALVMALLIFLFTAEEAEADLFGADVAVLTQIFMNSLQQLTQLRSIFETGSNTLGLLEEINRGINDSLHMAETLGLRVDPGIYRELRRLDQALDSVESIFGRTVDSPLAIVQRNTDKTVAEAITFNNELNEYAQKLDRVGEDIKKFSHVVSPGGAAKLTAESMGVMIHVLNQQMRATGQGLKLQAQGLALLNKAEKNKTEQYLKEGQMLKQKMQAVDAQFNAPRF